MFRPVAGSGQQPVAGMDPVIGDKDLGGLLQVIPGLVQRVRPEHIILALPIAECGCDNRVDRRDRQLFVFRDIGLSLAPVVNADILLQEFHGAIDQSLSISLDPDSPVIDDEAIGIFGRYPSHDITAFHIHQCDVSLVERPQAFDDLEGRIRE